MDHIFTHAAWLVVDASNLFDGRYFCCGSGDEAFREIAKLLWHDRPLNHFIALVARKADHRLPRDAIEEAIRHGGVDGPVLDEKDISTCGFGHMAAPIEH